MPRLPPAPAWFSTKNCLPKRSVNFCPISRATTSTGPAGANGTIRRTGRSGYVPCAFVWPAPASSNTQITKPRAITLIMPSSNSVHSFPRKREFRGHIGRLPFCGPESPPARGRAECWPDLRNALIRPDVGVADHFAPARDLGLDALAEFFRTVRDRNEAERFQALLDVRLGDHFCNRIAPLVDQLPRRARRRDDAGEGVAFE